MSDPLTEEQMRLPLLGHPRSQRLSTQGQGWPRIQKVAPCVSDAPPRLRVTLHVTRQFGGDYEVFIHEASTLSTILAEQ